MTIGTAVFTRIIEQHKQETLKVREAAEKTLSKVLKQTYRFSSFDDSYINACAKDYMDAALNDEIWRGYSKTQPFIS